MRLGASVLGRLSNPNPLTLPGGSSLLSWLRPTRGVTLATATVESGTTPPDVTLSGTLTQSVDLRIEITTSGPRGTAVFRWSVNGGASYTSGITTAASVALGSTGITANFATGTDYTNDNVYRSAIESWVCSHAHSFTNSGGTIALRPFYSMDELNGRPGVSFDGTAQTLHTTTGGLADALVGGSDTPCTMMGVFKYRGDTTPPSTARMWGISNGATDNSFLSFAAGTSGAYRTSKRAVAGSANTDEGGTVDNDIHLVEFLHSGTEITVAIDQVEVISAASQDVDSLTVTSVWLGHVNTPGAPADLYADVVWGEIAMWAGVIDDVARGYNAQRLINNYGL